MSYIDDIGIRRIINLKGSPLIEQSLADRQLEVVKTGFNFLLQEENNCLYLADEVGLGKTYIAFRHNLLASSFFDKPRVISGLLLSYLNEIFKPSGRRRYVNLLTIIICLQIIV